MSGGVLRGTAVEDIRSGDTVEITVGERTVVAKALSGSAAFACWKHAMYGRACAGKPLWRVERRGDAVVSWACSAHLAELVGDLQRPGEVTALLVMPSRAGEVS